MPSVLAYHRPGSLDEASTLLAGSNRRALAGGTLVVPASRRAVDVGVELVDLQALGLDTVAARGEHLALGAMTRLGDLATDERVPALLADLCRRELPSALRNQATIGGTVGAAESDSVLLAGLLVHRADVERHGAPAASLAEALAGAGDRGIVTTVTVEVAGRGTIAATGRTPADVPIVAAVARELSGTVTVALTGVADTPVLVDPGDPTAGLTPTSDFRGSADYRLHLASVLTERAVQEVTR